MSTETNTKIKTQINTDVKEPPLFRVIYLNDNATSMDFVIESLVEYFDYNSSTAQEITVTIHEAGSAVVAILPYEIAEQKSIAVTLLARTNGYPLQVKVESEK